MEAGKAVGCLYGSKINTSRLVIENLQEQNLVQNL